jgi:hypothetical protein
LCWMRIEYLGLFVSEGTPDVEIERRCSRHVDCDFSLKGFEVFLHQFQRTAIECAPELRT